MPVKKHDWVKYKQNYFDSPIDSIKDFFETFVIPVPKSSYKARAQGWIEEKQEYKRQQADAARAKAANDPDVKDLTNQLIRGKENALKIVMSKLSLSKVEQNDPKAFNRLKESLTMKDLKDGIDILKRELGEPLTISENKNKNENELTLGEDFKRLVEGYLAK